LGLSRIAHSAALVALAGAFSGSLWAAPQLRLSQTVVGPITVSQGSNAGNQQVFANNVGDGALNLRLTTNVTWLSVAAGPATQCSLRGICIPINLSFRTNTLTPGLYSGIVAVSDPNAVDAPQTIVVTVRVGSGVPEKAEFNLTPGASSQARFTTGNAIDTAATVQGSTNWLAVAAESAGSFAFGSTYRIVVNSGALAEGDYAGQIVTSRSPAANENRTIPVTLKVTSFSRLEAAQANTPVAFFGGVVNNATFEPDLQAPGGIAAVFGDGFATGTPAQPTTLPLPTEVESTRVLVNDKAAPLYYVSANQINFQVPYDTPTGTAIVRVERGGQRGNPVSMQIGRSSPRLLRLTVNDHGIAVNQDGSFPIPRTPGLNSRPARVGETLTMYAIGFGQTDPPVQSGAAAPVSPLGNAPGRFRVLFGTPGPFAGPIEVTPLYAGLTPNFVGLYQVNVTIPENAPRGNAVPVSLVSDEDGTSNRVTIAIE
jgi:uncharacterized protein (TIGR03437 family)